MRIVTIFVFALIMVFGEKGFSQEILTLSYSQTAATLNSGKKLNYRMKDRVFKHGDLIPRMGQVSRDGNKFYAVFDYGDGTYFLYSMERDAKSGEFGQPQRVPGRINGMEFNIATLTLSDDEETIVFTSSNDNTQSGNDLYIATKNRKTGIFENFRALDELNEKGISENYPWISGDGLRLYYTRQAGKDAAIWVATRTSLNSPFSQATRLDLDLPAVHNNLSCALSTDESEMFILSGNHVYYTKRSNLNVPFNKPVGVATAQGDGFLSGFSATSNFRDMFLFNSTGYRQTAVFHFENPDITQERITTTR